MRLFGSALFCLILGMPAAFGQAPPDVTVTSVDPVPEDSFLLDVGVSGRDFTSAVAIEARNWRVEEIGGTPRPIGVRAADFLQDPNLGVIQLRLVEPTDTNKHQYRVQFTPSGRQGQTRMPAQPTGKPSPILDFIKGSDGERAAAVDVSGSIQAGVNAKPNYAWEAKVKLLKNLDEGLWGSLGFQFTGKANKERNLDPDSLKASLRYEYEVVFKPRWYLLVDSDALGYEFELKTDKTTEKKNKNLTSGAEATLVVPSWKGIAPSFLLAGIEVGNNLSNFENPDGSGLIYRPLAGANITAFTKKVRPFQRIEVLAQYRVRFPRRLEAFSRVIDGTTTSVMTTKTRHYVGTDLDFILTDGFALSIKYRWGSLPPAFQFVDHQVTFGFRLKLKQVRR
jgi:hypothetical protein